MKLKLTKCIFIILISFFSAHCLSSTWYGTLRGNKIIDFKSPTTGVIDIFSAENGNIGENQYIFNIKDVDSPIKKEIILMKRDLLLKKKNDIESKLAEATKAYNHGYISKNRVNEYYQNLNDIKINLKELDSQYKSLEHLHFLSNPLIKNRYIYRNIHVSDGSFINIGDSIMKIETIDKFHVDIKIDPTTSILYDKKIKYRSLVTNLTGEAKLVNIVGSYSGETKNGLKTAIIQINNNHNEISHELLDTAFEITIDD